MFMKVLRDLFGCDDVRDPEMPITREGVNHLVKTGNPWNKTKSAATLQEYNLKFISCFTQDYTFEQLKLVGEKVVEDYHNYRRTAKAEPVKLSLDFSLYQNNIPREDLYMSHKDKITDDKESANNLRSLIYNKIQEKGSHYFLRSNIPLEEIFTLIADENPKFSKETLVYLPELLDISLEEFILLLTKDTDNPSAGF
jgi:hypothetical protein